MCVVAGALAGNWRGERGERQREELHRLLGGLQARPGKWDTQRRRRGSAAGCRGAFHDQDHYATRPWATTDCAALSALRPAPPPPSAP